MNIDIVTDTFSPDVNGISMIMGRLSEELRRRRHRVNVIHTGMSATAHDTQASTLTADEFKVEDGLEEMFDLSARWLKKRPDVIYVATKSPLGTAALKAANSLAIPVATGFPTNFGERADCMLGISRNAVDQLVAEGVANVHLLGSGVDANLFTPEKRCQKLRSQWGVGADGVVAIMVGRVAQDKNFDLVMLTFEQMRRTLPDIQCVVVGDGPLRKSLAASFPWVHFAGMKTGEDLASYYASADVLVCPSETDTFGNVLLEGMASGLVAVGFDTSAAALHVQSGENAFKVAKGDVAGFTRHAMDALALMPGHELRRAARSTAEGLGWDKVVGEFESRLAAITRSALLLPKLAKIGGKRPKIACRTVFLSDIHLGTMDSKADEVVEFLRHIHCQKLVLNGDIVDAWALERGGRWRSSHSHVIRKILKMTEHHGTEVIYLRGNHDDILERFLPLAFGRIRFEKELIHVTAKGKRYLVIHGDGFDSISTHHRWLASLGSVGYDFLLQVNRYYNLWRAWRGKEYFSLSKKVKAKVKSAICYVDRYTELLQDLARHRKCDGIICGHIHTPEDKQVGDIHYLNSGDWVESLSAIIEHHDGRMELVRYGEFIASLKQPVGLAASNESAETGDPATPIRFAPVRHAIHGTANVA